MKLPYLMPEEAKARQSELLQEAAADQLAQQVKRHHASQQEPEDKLMSFFNQQFFIGLGVGAVLTMAVIFLVG